MGKWLAVLVIVAAFTGSYWAVMSGYAAERALAFDIRGAARQNDAQSILDELKKAERRLDSQQQWVKRFNFIARNPDWSRVNETRRTLHELQKEVSDVVAVSGGEIGSEGVESTRRYLRTMPLLTASVFRPGEDTLWKVLFWVSASGAVIVALLLFVRRFGD